MSAAGHRRPGGHGPVPPDAMAVQVGPPNLTIHADEQFLVSDAIGEVHGERRHGYFVNDTRLVSGYRIRLQGERPVLLDSSAVQPFSARYELVNPRLRTPRGPVDAQTVHLRVDRTISSGLHEDYELTNYGTEPVELELAIHVECDFATVLEVRRGRFLHRETGRPSPDASRSALEARYVQDGFRRGLRIQVERAGARPVLVDGTVTFQVSLASHGHWHACLLWMPAVDELDPAPPERGCHDLLGSDTERDVVRRRWLSTISDVETDDAGCNRVIRQSVDDLVSMRITSLDIGTEAETAQPEGWIPAAGIPWYLALFGRDPLVLAHQTFVLSPRFALAILQALARFQGDEYDDARDLQPGKILHELRRGEAARLGIAPPSPYYGTHDATSLFVWVAAETWRWLGERAPVERLRPHVDRALQWIDRDGDLDGDGLQEYRTRAGEHGSYNQGWKDSGDAIVHEDGSQAPLPLATCELQGYVVAAKRG